MCAMQHSPGTDIKLLSHCFASSVLFLLIYRAEYGMKVDEATKLKEEVDGRVQELEEGLASHTGE